MFSVIGCENVAPDGVKQSPAFQLPETHAQLLSVTVTLLRLRAVPARLIWFPNSLKAYASAPTLGRFERGPFGVVLLYTTLVLKPVPPAAAADPATRLTAATTSAAINTKRFIASFPSFR